MKNKILNILVLVLLLILSFYTLHAQTVDQCIKCHSDLDDTHAKLFKTDVRVAMVVMQLRMIWI